MPPLARSEKKNAPRFASQGVGVCIGQEEEIDTVGDITICFRSEGAAARFNPVVGNLHLAAGHTRRQGIA